MSRKLSGRGRHISSPSSLDLNLYASYGEYTQQYIADRRLTRQKDSTSSASSVALETTQIQISLKKPELRHGVSIDKQRGTSNDGKTSRSFSSLSEGHARNSRVIIVHPAKKVSLFKCAAV
ncbi:unnamed protein product [Gongylonema pulchrum]|uniref:Uncharacterized protein n=1 Tax=Gongylonema pulchrum TaxID=637853 RepID=A0A183ETH1_9BILA|nr:unnamed protein product [Gongylonema pulchrum]